MSQRIIWDTEKLPSKEVVGPKAYNLMVMKRAGIPIPRFFTVLSDGSSNVTLEEAVIGETSKLGEDLVIRSCHPFESGEHPFSGKFLSDWCSGGTEDIKRAYREVKEGAKEKRVMDYVAKQGIKGFNPNAMNVIFMQNFPHRFFGMYMTSTQNNSNEMIVNFWDSREGKGNWELFDKVEGKLKTNTFCYDGSTEAMNQFGEVGVRAEQLFGRPVQLESAIDDEGLLQVFQAKEIELTDPLSLAKPSEYRTMITGLSSQGNVSYNGPVLVLDGLRNVFPDEHYQTREDGGRLMQRYQDEISQFRAENGRYVVVMKDLTEFLGVGCEDQMLALREERYAYLNSIVKDAVVQIRSKAQSVVRHEDWDNVEKGGAIIFIDDYKQRSFADKFSHTPRYGGDRGSVASSRKESLYMRGKGLVPINMINRVEVCTGDNLDVLCNEDGVFIW